MTKNEHSHEGTALRKVSPVKRLIVISILVSLNFVTLGCGSQSSGCGGPPSSADPVVPAFRPVCTPESTSLTCMAEQDRLAKEKAAEKDKCSDCPPIPVDKLPAPEVTPTPTKDPEPKKAEPVVIVPEKKVETTPDPAKARNQAHLAECLKDEKPKGDPSWTKEYSTGESHDETDRQDRVENLRLTRERYKKCVQVMTGYFTEYEKCVEKDSDKKSCNFADYSTYSSRVVDTLDTMARNYAYALVQVVSENRWLAGYDFGCTKQCDAPTRYQLVAELVDLMKERGYRPDQVWRGGTGEQLREFAKSGYRELYQSWSLQTPGPAKDRLRQVLCTDLPKSGDLKPLMDVEVGALGCDKKITPQDAAKAAQTAILPIYTEFGCSSDKDCKGNRICEKGQCIDSAPIKKSGK